MNTTQDRTSISSLHLSDVPAEFSPPIALRLKRYLATSTDLVFEILHKIETDLELS